MVKRLRRKAAEAGSKGLHLLAFDEDDLSVMSVHLQDSITRIADMAWLPRERRFALVASRFDWTGAAEGERQKRRMAGVHFDSVTKVQRTGFTQDKPDAILNLLSIAFEPGEAPSGQVVLLFSAGAAIRLDVECIDAQLSDIGPVWRARTRPVHDDPDGEA